MNSKTFFLLIVLCFFMSCISTNNNPSVEKDDEIEIAENRTPRIAFLSYRFYLDDNDNAQASLINKIITEGTFKNADDTVEDTSLEIRQLDSDKKIVAILNINNPLQEVVEYVNDKKEFEKKMVNHREKEVFYRIQIQPQTVFVEVIQKNDPVDRSLTLTKI